MSDISAENSLFSSFISNQNLPRNWLHCCARALVPHSKTGRRRSHQIYSFSLTRSPFSHARRRLLYSGMSTQRRRRRVSVLCLFAFCQRWDVCVSPNHVLCVFISLSYITSLSEANTVRMYLTPDCCPCIRRHNQKRTQENWSQGEAKKRRETHFIYFVTTRNRFIFSFLSASLHCCGTAHCARVVVKFIYFIRSISVMKSDSGRHKRSQCDTP